MGLPEKSGPGPLPAIVGGVVAAFLLVWLAGIVIGAFVFAVRIVVFGAVIAGALWLWGKLRGD